MAVHSMLWQNNLGLPTHYTDSILFCFQIEKTRFVLKLRPHDGFCIDTVLKRQLTLNVPFFVPAYKNYDKYFFATFHFFLLMSCLVTCFLPSTGQHL